MAARAHVPHGGALDRAPDVDSYLAAVPGEARAALEALRQLIHDAVPAVEESIGYDMPAFSYRGKPLVYFAAWKNHCALYGLAAGTIQFRPANPPAEAFVREQLTRRSSEIDAGLDRKRGKRTR